jgi:hypothetical protein
MRRGAPGARRPTAAPRSAAAPKCRSGPRRVHPGLMQGIVVAVAQRHGELARLEPGAPAPLPVKSMSRLPHHDSHRARDDVRKVIWQFVDLACYAVKFPIEVIEPCVHVELDVPQLARDEAELSFELRESRLGEIDATLQVSKFFFQIDRPLANN